MTESEDMAAEDVKLIGFGDNVVDCYLDLGVMYPGGNALNAAVYAARLGAETAYLGTFGTDAAGDHVRTVLANLGIETKHCRVIEGENGCAWVRLKDGNRIFAGSNKGGVVPLHPFVPDQEILAYLSAFDVVHTSCYSYLDPQLPVLRGAAHLLSYDASWKWRDSDLLERIGPFVDFVAISVGEGGRQEAEAAIARAHRSGATVVLATMGADGALAFAGQSLLAQAPAPARVVDTMGAGDAFLTATLIGLRARGWTQSQPPSDEILDAALADAAPFAAEICGLNGAFGEPATMPNEIARC